MAGKEHARPQSKPASIHQIRRLGSVIVELIGRVAPHRPDLLSPEPVEDTMNGEDVPRSHRRKGRFLRIADTCSVRTITLAGPRRAGCPVTGNWPLAFASAADLSLRLARLSWLSCLLTIAALRS